MANLHIDTNYNPIQAFVPNTSSEVIDGTSASAQTAAVLSTTGYTLVRLSAQTADCYYKLGSNPTAVSGSDIYLAKGSYEYVIVPPAEKIAVIGGKLNITKAR